MAGAVIVAGVATLISTALVRSSFAPAPRLTRPGVVAVSIDSPQSLKFAPITVDVLYGASVDTPGTRMEVILRNKPGSTAPTARDTNVVIFLCGPMAQGAKFSDTSGRPVAWRTLPDTGRFNLIGSVGGPMESCVYTRVAASWDPYGARAQRLLGVVLPPSVNVSGNRLLYVLPGVTVFPAIPIDGLSLQPIPADSTATVSLLRPPNDFVAGTASPQLPDEGELKWLVDFGEQSAKRLDYRLSGELLNREQVQQRSLFMAGACAGVAGGAILLMLEALVRLGFGASLMRGRRRLLTTMIEEPLIGNASSAEPNDHVSKTSSHSARRDYSATEPDNHNTRSHGLHHRLGHRGSARVVPGKSAWSLALALVGWGVAVSLIRRRRRYGNPQR